MNWLVLSFLTAICEATKDIFSKKGLEHNNVYIIAWAYRLFALPFLLPILFICEIPEVKNEFWFALIIGGGLNIITTVLYMKAISYSDLSVTVPMVAFTPLFLLISSPIIIGEIPGKMGFIGVILIVTGSYLLNIKQIRNGWFAPFTSLISEKGPRYMLVVAFIWSITSNFDKIGVQESSPLFWAVSVNIFISLAMIPLVVLKSKSYMIQIVSNYRSLIPIGLFGAATLIFQMLAINLTLVAYVISIKRTSSIMVVLAGYWFFKEKGITQRFVGASIMVAGVILIAYF